MNRRYAQEYLSEYLEGGLAPPEREEIERLLAEDKELAQEARQLQKMLTVLHELPPREPVLDIWSELSPRLTEAAAEERLSLWERLRLRRTRFLASFAEGTILWTQAVAMNTEARMRKYVLQHPLTPSRSTEEA